MMRLRHVRSARARQGQALNEALRLARGAIVVCTDDDCQAPPGWISGMARALESQPTAVLAFCRVLPVAHDRSAGYVPAYELEQSRLLRSITAICGGLGIGAGLALQRDFVLSIGGFDEAFRAAFPRLTNGTWRCARCSGRHVFETAELAIVHDGFRVSNRAARMLGATGWLSERCAPKPLRAGHWKAAVIPVWLFSTKALWPPLADALSLRKPRGAGRIIAFVQGFAQGLVTRAALPLTLPLGPRGQSPAHPREPRPEILGMRWALADGAPVPPRKVGSKETQGFGLDPAQSPWAKPVTKATIRPAPRGLCSARASAMGGHTALVENSQTGTTAAFQWPARRGLAHTAPGRAPAWHAPGPLRRTEAVVHDRKLCRLEHVPAAEQRAHRQVPLVGRGKAATGAERFVEATERLHEITAQSHAGAEAEPAAHMSAIERSKRLWTRLYAGT